MKGDDLRIRTIAEEFKDYGRPGDEFSNKVGTLARAYLAITAKQDAENGNAEGLIATINSLNGQLAHKVEWRKEIEAQLTASEAAFRKYGGHTASCPRRQAPRPYTAGPQCSCGWPEAQAARAPVKEPSETGRVEMSEWQLIETAPKDGTLLLLLIAAKSEHPLEDSAGPTRTVGFNNFDNDGTDEWKFAGWCWDQDHFTEGHGSPMAWQSFPDDRVGLVMRPPETTGEKGEP